MCPHCGTLFDKVDDLIPAHHYENGSWCAGTGQIPRNPLSDGRPLWNGRSNPYFYRNKKESE